MEKLMPHFPKIKWHKLSQHNLESKYLNRCKTRNTDLNLKFYVNKFPKHETNVKYNLHSIMYTEQ